MIRLHNQRHEEYLKQHHKRKAVLGLWLLTILAAVLIFSLL